MKMAIPRIEKVNHFFTNWNSGFARDFLPLLYLHFLISSLIQLCTYQIVLLVFLHWHFQWCTEMCSGELFSYSLHLTHTIRRIFIYGFALDIGMWCDVQQFPVIYLETVSRYIERFIFCGGIKIMYIISTASFLLHTCTRTIYCHLF